MVAPALVTGIPNAVPIEARQRVYYLHTGLPRYRCDEIRLLARGLGEYAVADHAGMLAVFARGGKPFARLADAQTALRRLRLANPVDFAAAAVAVIDVSARYGAIDVDNGRQTLEMEPPTSTDAPQAATWDRSALLVCADDSLRFRVTRLLHDDLGMRVIAAPEGQSALCMCDDRQVDLLIADLRLPDMHGWALLQGCRERLPKNPPRAIILADADADEREETFALAVAGVDAFLIRPFSDGRFRVSVRDAFADSTALPAAESGTLR